MVELGPSLYIQMELRNAITEAETLQKKYFMSSLKGAGIVFLGILGYGLNYMTIPEMKQVAEHASEIVNNYLARSYMALEAL